MINMETRVLLTIFLLLLCGCKQSPQAVSLQMTDTKDTLLRYADEWKKDSLGCLKLRSKEKAEMIMELLKKDVVTVQKLYSSFGVPNEEKRNNSNLILTYYFDCICKKGELVENSDKCYFNIYITANIFKNVDFVCE
jgi:hypothetical protein